MRDILKARIEDIASQRNISFNDVVLEIEIAIADRINARLLKHGLEWVLTEEAKVMLDFRMEVSKSMGYIHKVQWPNVNKKTRIGW